MRREKRLGERLMTGLFYLGLFGILVIFFVKFRPLVVDNMDDWTYLAFTRPAKPIWHYWNPAKILPEILTPLCALAARWLVTPFTGDFVGAVSVVTGMLLSAMILLYLALFARLLQKRMALGTPVTLLLTALFAVFHFKSWMSPWIASRHLFYAECLTTCFNYLIPALLNIQLVLMMEIARDERRPEGEHAVLKGGMIVLLYLAIFSNLFSSVVLAVYAGWRLLCAAAEGIRDKAPVRAWFKANGWPLGILAAWGVSAVFELSGGRARGMGSALPLLDRIKSVVHIFLLEMERMEDSVFYMCAAMLAAGLIALCLSRIKTPRDRAYGRMVLRCLACAGVTLLYLILLSAATEPSYIARMEVLICMMAPVLTAAFLSLGYLIARWRSVAMAIPLVTFVMAFDVLIGADSFAQSNVLGQSAQTCMQTNRSFLQEILSADREGVTEMTLSVPRCDGPSNWPYTYEMGGRMVTTLRQLDMVEHIQTIHIEPVDDFAALHD